MATQTDGPRRTFKAGADLSSNQFFIVRQSAADTVTLASSATQADIVGTLENKPKNGENASVLMRHGGGTGKVKLGGTVAIGDFLTTNSAGKAIKTTTSGNEVIGRALQAGVADDVIEYVPSNELY